MNAGTDSQIAAGVLERIAQQLGGSFRLGVRWPQGESGQAVWRMTDAAGSRLVLKCHDSALGIERWQDGALVTQFLRAQGYPSPLYLAVGRLDRTGYLLQERRPGEPARRFRAALLPQLLRLNQLQAGAAAACGLTGNWPWPVATPVLVGGDGFCLHEPLLGYSAAAVSLLPRLQALAERGAVEPCRTGDVVHFDWNPGNLLVAGEAITGVIDWDGVCAGDRVFDLATALFYGYEDERLRQGLWQAVRGRISPALAGLYLAHLILRQVDWSIRHHSAADADRWIALGRRVLSDLQAA